MRLLEFRSCAFQGVCLTCESYSTHECGESMSVESELHAAELAELAAQLSTHAPPAAVKIVYDLHRV